MSHFFATYSRSKYKTIEIAISPTVHNKTVIEFVNSHFSQDDIHVTYDDQSVRVHMHQVDMDDLKTHLEPFISAEQGSIANTILASIEKIGGYAMNGNKRLFVGYNKERKAENRKKKEAQRGKHYYADNNEFVDNNMDIPDKFRNSILCGDSEELLKDIPDNCIDLVFTSPPYNFGLNYGEYEDAAQWESYFDKLFAIFDQCIRVLKYGGRIIIDVQPLFSDYIPNHHIITNHFIKRKMIWRGEIIWEKNNYNCKYTSWGSWKSPSSPYLKYTWEFLEIFCKGSLKKKGISENIDIDGDSFKKWVYGKWSVGTERNMKSYGHPAMFPEELARRALQLFSFRGDTVLDPFMGAGTTCVVARRTGRNYVGIDVNEKYCDTTRSRLASILDTW